MAIAAAPSTCLRVHPLPLTGIIDRSMGLPGAHLKRAVEILGFAPEAPLAVALDPAMWRLVRGEAAAYVRLGLLALDQRRVVSSAEGPGVGVLFVPGLAANSSQFLALKAALSPAARSFDAFEYSSFHDLRRTAGRLARRIASMAEGSDSILAIGHSLGGLLLRIALQREELPERALGYVSICAPLHGTSRSQLAPSPSLKALSPDSALIQELVHTAPRLERLRGNVLTIGARHDQFIRPYTSAFLDAHETLELPDVAHVGSLFDPRVHRSILALATRLGPSLR